MAHKKICLKCRISFSINTNSELENNKVVNCSNCHEAMLIVHHKFKPPKRNDLKKWKFVELLVNNGFLFQSVYENISVGVFLKVDYPKNLKEAKEFVEKHKKSKLNTFSKC